MTNDEVKKMNEFLENAFVAGRTSRTLHPDADEHAAFCDWLSRTCENCRYEIATRRTKQGNYVCLDCVGALGKATIAGAMHETMSKLPRFSDAAEGISKAIQTLHGIQMDVVKQREQYIALFLKETGLRPSECEQVVIKDGPVTRWYLRKIPETK